MEEVGFFGLLFLAGIILLIVRAQTEQKRQKMLVRKQIREEYGVSPMKHRGRDEAAVKGSYLHFIEKNPGFFLDDITWNDLDLELVFQRMNYTRSSAGTEELYRMLRCPAVEKTVLQERNALADGFGRQETLRGEISFLLHGIGFTGKYALEDYLDYLGALSERKNLKHILLDCLYILPIGLLFWQPSLGVALLFVVLVVNILTYFKE